MKKVSSPFTFFYNRVVPLGSLTAVLFWASTRVEHAYMIGDSVAYALLWPILLAIVLYGIMKLLFLKLLDQVWDGGDFLEVRRGRKVDRIQLAEIESVSYRTSAKMPNANLVLVRSCRFGQVLFFVPAGDFWEKPNLGGLSPVEDLLQRIKRARGGS